MPLSLFDFVNGHSRLFVLTGAGVSTASGIPDYRDRDGQWKQKKPVDYRDFVREHQVRQRYWARSAIGWPRVSNAKPGAAHIALAKLEQLKTELTTVTQNVDGLHQRAGSSRVIDLHGKLDRVICLDCRRVYPRVDIQKYLLQHNPQLESQVAVAAPDGHVQLDGIEFSEIDIPQCVDCGGMLKPDVVFFGENVPKQRVIESFDVLDQADVVLVVGSSLMVYSGYRFVKKALEMNLPIAVVNQGKTRADDLLGLKIERDCGEALTELVAQMEKLP